MIEQKSGHYGAIESKLAPRDLARYIDHTLLKPEATCDDIKQVCNEAKSCGFASVCVNPSYIKLVADELKGSNVTPCCVIAVSYTHLDVYKRQVRARSKNTNAVWSGYAFFIEIPPQISTGIRATRPELMILSSPSLVVP